MVKIVLGGKKPAPQQGGHNGNNQGNHPNAGDNVNKNSGQGMNLFGSKKQNAPVQDDSNLKEEVSGVNRRLKLIEERYNNLRNRSPVTEQNMLNKNKTFYSEIKTLNLELTEVKKEINEIKDKMVRVVHEMETFAKKDNLEILRKYIDMWSPMKFVGRDEVKDIIREVIDDMRRERE